MSRITNLLNNTKDLTFGENQYCIYCGTFRGSSVYLEKHIGSFKLTMEDPELQGYFHVLKTGTWEQVTDYYLRTMGCFC